MKFIRLYLKQWRLVIREYLTPYYSTKTTITCVPIANSKFTHGFAVWPPPELPIVVSEGHTDNYGEDALQRNVIA